MLTEKNQDEGNRERKPKQEMDPCLSAMNRETGKGKEWNVLNLNNTSASSMRELSSLDSQCIKKYIQISMRF